MKHAAFAAALVALAPLSAAAQTGPVTGDAGALGAAVIGHVRVVDALSRGDTTWSLGDDGLVIEWFGDTPIAWARVEGAYALAAAGERLAVLAPAALVTLAPGLADETSVPVDGAAPCWGASTAWIWTDDSEGLRLLSSDGITPVRHGEPPLDAARCSVAGSEAALAWDDGFGAVGIAVDGQHLEGVWYGDGQPRAVRDGGAWRLLRPDEPSPRQACDVLDGPEGCAAWHAALDPRAPRLRELIGAALLDDGIVLADRAGWSVAVVRGNEQSVVRFAHPTFGLSDAREPVIFSCDPRAPRIVVYAAGFGAELASHPIDVCPTGLRDVAGRPTMSAGDVTLVWDATTRSFTGGAASELADGGFSLEHGWTAACAGVAATLYDRGGRRAFGPACGEHRLEPVVTTGGRTRGAALCAQAPESEAAAPVAVFRLDGSPLTDPLIGDCGSDSLRLSDEEPTLVDAADVVFDGARARLGRGADAVTVIAAEDGLVVFSDDELWVSPGLHDRVVWWRGGRAHLVSDPATESVWEPRLLGRALASSPP